MINWRLLASPRNWLFVAVVLIGLGYAGHLLLTAAGFEPAASDESQTSDE